MYTHGTLPPPPPPHSLPPPTPPTPPTSFEAKHKGASRQTSCHQFGQYVLLMVARSSPVQLNVKLECGQLHIPFFGA